MELHASKNKILIFRGKQESKRIIKCNGKPEFLHISHQQRCRELSKDCKRTPFCCCNSSSEGVQVHTPAWFELHWVGPRRWWRGAVDFFNQLSSNLLFWQHLCFIMSHFVFHSNEIKKRQVRFLGISENEVCFM